jgi:HK97 family phage prohead protease
MANREFRQSAAPEVRADGDSVTVEGYAAVFDQETNVGGMFVEVIKRGAFSDAVGRDDVVFLINHEGLPLARTRAGTLDLTEDSHGLKVRTSLDTSDPDVARIVPKMRRGDLDKMSFAFRADPGGQDWDDSGDIPKRTIRKASLFDVSIVTDPQYSGTEIGLRALKDHLAAKQEDLQAWRLRQKAKFLR